MAVGVASNVRVDQVWNNQLKAQTAHSCKDHGNMGINSFLFSRGGTDKNQGDKGLAYGHSSLSGIWSRNSIIGPGGGWSWATKAGLELTGHF